MGTGSTACQGCPANAMGLAEASVLVLEQVSTRGAQVAK